MVSCTANFYRDLQGFYRDLWVQGFFNYRDYMYPAFPVLFYRDSLYSLQGNTCRREKVNKKNREFPVIENPYHVCFPNMRAQNMIKHAGVLNGNEN